MVELSAIDGTLSQRFFLRHLGSLVTRETGRHPFTEFAEAAYGVRIARNHPFADGNKRAAFLDVGLFLGLNSLRLSVDKVNATTVMLSVAAGEMAEDDFAAWIRRHIRSRA
jgi:death-on-curing protein